MENAKTLPVIIAAVFVILGISVAVPKIRDKEKGGAVSAAAVEPTAQAETTAAPEPETVVETVLETQTDEQGSVFSTVVTTVKTVTTAKPSATAAPKAKKTTEKPEQVTETKKESVSKSALLYVDRLGRCLTEKESEAVLCYTYNNTEDYYYSSFDVPAGTAFSTYRDTISPLKTQFSDLLDVQFDYNGKAWLVHLVKGQYAWLYVGGSAEIYNNSKLSAEQTVGSDDLYQVPEKAECPDIATSVLWSPAADEHISVSRNVKNAWNCNGFVFGNVKSAASPLTELIMKVCIKFCTEDMAKLYVQGLQELAFGHAESETALTADTYFQSNETVWLCWQAKTGGVTVAKEKPAEFTTQSDNTEKQNKQNS